MPRQFNTDDLRKALDQYSEYERNNPYEYDDAREALIDRAVENRLLDEFIENEIRYNRENDPYYYEDPDYDPNEPIDQSEIDDYARRLNVSDLPDAVPYSDNVSVDVDYEDLNVYNLVNENPKAREFFTNNRVQFDPAERTEAGNRFLRALRAGTFTPEQLNLLANVRGIGTSLSLENMSDEATAYEVANFVNRAATGRDVAPLEPIYENTAETINTIADLSAVDRALRQYSYDLRDTRERLERLQTAGSTPVSGRPEVSTQRGRSQQLSLPLESDSTQGRLAPLATAFESLPTSFNTVSDLTEARNRLQNIQRDLSGLISIRNDSSDRARDFIRSSVLPSVRDALGETATDRAVSNAYRNIMNERNEAEDRARNADAPRARRRPYDASTPMPVLGRSSEGMEPITGLNEELQRGRIEEVRQAVAQFPEVERLLRASLKDPERSPIRGAAAKPYLAYADTQQVISMPEERVQLYETLLETEPEFVADPAGGLNVVQDIETLYTSGNPELQQRAFETLDSYGFGDRLREISVPATSTTRPIVGGGGYVGGSRDTDESRALRERIKTRAQALETALSGNEDLLRSTYPGFFDRPSVSRKLEVVYDPDTDTVRPAGPGDTNTYGIAVSTGNPRLNPTEAVYALGNNTVSANALRFFADNPILGTTSVSFTTRTPSEGYSYDPKDLPSAVSDAFGRFAQRTALQGLPPGTLVSNSPLSSDDLLRSKRREGKTAETSSTVRKLEAFESAGQPLPNLRAAAYTTAGFGPYTGGSQYAYIDAEGKVVPVQLERSGGGFSDALRFNPYSNEIEVGRGRLPLTTKAYYSTDPVAAAAQGLAELGRGIRRTPAALAPGAADLIPSPEAIQTGYREGVLPMVRQMGTEFVQSLPTAAATSAVLATPIAAPLAPGIGAGMVGVAGTRALNEVVRQQTGEGVVPKLRQTIGTAPRTGVANRAAPVATNLQRAIGTPAVQNGKTVYWAGPDYGWQSGSSFNKVRDSVIARETVAPTRRNLGSRPAVIPQIRPLNPVQRAEMQRRQKRNELQRRVDLANEQRNIWRGDLGLTELLFGR